MIRPMNTPSSVSIVQKTNTAIDHAQHLKRVKDETLKQTAASAAGDKDADALFAVLWAYTTRGSKSKASPHTAASYERGVRLFIEFVNKEGITILRPQRQNGDNFVEFLEGKGYAPKTTQARLAAVKALYAALRWSGATTARPFQDTKAPSNKEDESTRRDKPYTQSEVDKLLGAANDLDAVLVLLGAHAGLRVDEATSLLWTKPTSGSSEACYISQDGLLRIFGKGRRERMVFVSPTLAAALSKWRAVTPHTTEPRVLPFTTTRARQRLQALTKKAGVTWRGVHGLRHFCGTNIYVRTRSAKAVKDHLGHANLITTDKYIGWADTLLQDTIKTL